MQASARQGCRIFNQWHIRVRAFTGQRFGAGKSAQAGNGMFHTPFVPSFSAEMFFVKQSEDGDLLT
jgi:hypothetical protein